MGRLSDTQMFDAISSSGTRNSSRPSSIAGESGDIESPRSASPIQIESTALPGWQITAFLKRQQRAAKFPSVWLLPDSALPGPDVVNVVDWCNSSSHLSPLEQCITASTACVIVDRIAKREWTSLQVMQAFCHRASTAQRESSIGTSGTLLILAHARNLELHYRSKTVKLRSDIV